MKPYLAITILFISVGCGSTGAQSNILIRDSIWPTMKDTTYALDSAGMYYWGHSWDKTTHIHKKYDKPGPWYLYNIKDTIGVKLYTYFRFVPYDYITDGGFDDAVGRMEYQYMKSQRLEKGSSDRDTIPSIMSIVIPDDSLKQWTYRSDYHIGGIFGIYLYSKIDSIVPFKPKK